MGPEIDKYRASYSFKMVLNISSFVSCIFVCKRQCLLFTLWFFNCWKNIIYWTLMTYNSENKLRANLKFPSIYQVSASSSNFKQLSVENIFLSEQSSSLSDSNNRLSWYKHHFPIVKQYTFVSKNEIK